MTTMPPPLGQFLFRIGNNPVGVSPSDAPALQPGMFYQWRAISFKDASGPNVAGPISATEDLLGVFFIPGSVN